MTTGLNAPAPERPPAPIVFGWAVFLASSWTWCIGMFLPVYLMRDYGPWSILVFALPNIIGAAAMGAIVGTPTRSKAIAGSHDLACWLFSTVTTAFQSFFIVWLIMRWGMSIEGIVLLVVGIVIQAMRIGSGKKSLLIAACVFLASVACGLYWIMKDQPAAMPDASTFNSARPAELPWIAAVSCFGFALCPYLDLTFHRARRSLAGNAGSMAFAIGFLVLFPLMLALTWLYAPGILKASAASGIVPSPGLAHFAIGLHMAVQLSFTIAAHAPYIGDERNADSPSLLPAAGFGAFIAGLLLALLCFQGLSYKGTAFSELVYKGFMFLYALVFPGYVWLCMLPNWKSSARPSRRQLAAWIASSLIAMPMFWLGFIDQQEFWLGPGLAVVLAARAFVGRGSPDDQGRLEPSDGPSPIHDDRPAGA